MERTPTTVVGVVGDVGDKRRFISDNHDKGSVGGGGGWQLPPLTALERVLFGPEGAILGIMLAASPWYTAHDNDAAGDKAASAWPSRARRVRPPGHYKDWGEVVSAGVDLARWWADILGGTTNPRLFTWEELASWRWAGSTDADVNIERGG